MQVEILEIENTSTSQLCILLKSKYGNFRAIWEGCTPILNSEYNVELTLTDSFIWEKNVIFSNNNEVKIHTIDNTTYISGSFVDLDDDGTLILQLGNSTIMLETEGVPNEVNSTVNINTNILTVFDSNI